MNLNNVNPPNPPSPSSIDAQTSFWVAEQAAANFARIVSEVSDTYFEAQRQMLMSGGTLTSGHMQAIQTQQNTNMWQTAIQIGGTVIGGAVGSLAGPGGTLVGMATGGTLASGISSALGGYGGYTAASQEMQGQASLAAYRGGMYAGIDHAALMDAHYRSNMTDAQKAGGTSYLSAYADVAAGPGRIGQNDFSRAYGRTISRDQPFGDPATAVRYSETSMDLMDRFPSQMGRNDPNEWMERTHGKNAPVDPNPLQNKDFAKQWRKDPEKYMTPQERDQFTQAGGHMAWHPWDQDAANDFRQVGKDIEKADYERARAAQAEASTHTQFNPLDPIGSMMKMQKETSEFDPSSFVADFMMMGKEKTRALYKGKLSEDQMNDLEAGPLKDITFRQYQSENSMTSARMSGSAAQKEMVSGTTQGVQANLASSADAIANSAAMKRGLADDYIKNMEQYKGLSIDPNESRTGMKFDPEVRKQALAYQGEASELDVAAMQQRRAGAEYGYQIGQGQVDVSRSAISIEMTRAKMFGGASEAGAAMGSMADTYKAEQGNIRGLLSDPNVPEQEKLHLQTQLNQAIAQEIEARTMSVRVTAEMNSALEMTGSSIAAGQMRNAFQAGVGGAAASPYVQQNITQANRAAAGAYSNAETIAKTITDAGGDPMKNQDYRNALDEYTNRSGAANAAIMMQSQTPNSVGLRREEQGLGYEVDILQNMPGTYGSLRGALQSQFKNQQARADEVMGWRENARAKYGDLTPDQQQESELGFDRRLQGIGREEAGTFNQLSYGWQSRLYQDVINTPGNFAYAAPFASYRAAVGAGVNSPFMGSKDQSALPGLLRQAMEFSTLGSTGTPQEYNQAVIAGGGRPEMNPAFSTFGADTGSASPSSAQDFRSALEGLTIKIEMSDGNGGTTTHAGRVSMPGVTNAGVQSQKGYGELPLFGSKGGQ